MRHSISIGTFALLAAILLANPAFAHAELESAIPAPDAAVSTSPKELKLNFNEAIIVKFSGVDLRDEGGRQITTGDPVADSKDPRLLIVPLPTPLSGGRYTVSWHAVSEDTHRVKGQYLFKVSTENPPSQVQGERGRDRKDDPAADPAPLKKRSDDGECRCGDRGERSSGVRERMTEEDHGWDQRNKYRASRRNSKPPECIIDDEGIKYCRVR